VATDKQKGGSPLDFVVYFPVTYSVCKQQAQYISFSRFSPERYIHFSSIEVLCNIYKIHTKTNVKLYTLLWCYFTMQCQQQLCNTLCTLCEFHCANFLLFLWNLEDQRTQGIYNPTAWKFWQPLRNRQYTNSFIQETLKLCLKRELSISITRFSNNLSKPPCTLNYKSMSPYWII
jgi:hypothetical protein